MTADAYTTDSVTLPNLSDLLTVNSEAVVESFNSLLEGFQTDGVQVFRDINLFIKRREMVISDCFQQFERDDVHVDAFLQGINYQFALLTGLRQFLLYMTEQLPALAVAGSKDAEAKRFLIGAETVVDNRMREMTERIKTAVKSEPFLLYWEQERGFFLHRVRISENNFGF